MEVLVREYEKPVYNAAFRMLGNRDDACDATQSTFLKAFQKIDQFDPAYKFFSWLYRIALNESIDMTKRQHVTETLTDQIPVSGAGPEHAAESENLSNELQYVLNELSSDYRSVVVLKYFSGCSYEDIASILDVPQKTVKSRLYSARKRMKSVLEQRGISL